MGLPLVDRCVRTPEYRDRPMSSLDDVRAHPTAEREDEQGYAIPAQPSDWAALTDDEFFRLRRKIEHENRWRFDLMIQNELASRLIHALALTRASSDAAAKRLAWLTVVLVVLTVVIAGFTIALFFKG